MKTYELNVKIYVSDDMSDAEMKRRAKRAMKSEFDREESRYGRINLNRTGSTGRGTTGRGKTGRTKRRDHGTTMFGNSLDECRDRAREWGRDLQAEMDKEERKHREEDDGFDFDEDEDDYDLTSLL